MGQNPNLIYSPSWKKVQKADLVYLTFGMIDSISLHLLGFASISTTTGKSARPEALVSIRKPICIIPDKGEEKSALHLAASLGWRGKVLKIDWPDGCKDCNDMLVKHHAELIKALEGSNGYMA